MGSDVSTYLFSYIARLKNTCSFCFKDSICIRLAADLVFAASCAMPWDCRLLDTRTKWMVTGRVPSSVSEATECCHWRQCGCKSSGPAALLGYKAGPAHLSGFQHCILSRPFGLCANAPQLIYVPFYTWQKSRYFYTTESSKQAFTCSMTSGYLFLLLEV